MSDSRREEAERIARELSKLPPERRESRLEEVCGGDEALRRDVASLLMYRQAGTEVGRGPTVEAAPTRGNGSPPSHVGPYRVLHEIGGGGFGVVYLGVREGDQFRHHVAIKVLKRGMDTAEVIRRFELERQLLAALNHAGIARLYDAGETDDGTPYFVMEHVEGLELDRYCDSHRLGIDERLEIFRKVCEAVHHAHQNLVVHRDLKPRNILVTSAGEPKLLDFGIAKLINPEFSLGAADPTAPELRIMTPEYASPEQVRGEPITTASDVYSLGVLLYRIVTGHAPYRLATRARAEVERVICQEDPEKPSTAISRVEETEEPTGGTTTVTPESVSRSRVTRPERLRRRLAGDIDNIVLMAMRKEPQRRYRSAEQLAEDIERHMRGMPVVARPDTARYRAAKFVARNRGGVAAAAAILVALLGGLAIAGSGWAAAERAGAEAEQAFEAEREAKAELRKYRKRYLGRVEDMIRGVTPKIAPLDGAMAARSAIADLCLEMISKLKEEAGEHREVRRQLANAHDLAGDVLGGIRASNFGDLTGALENYRAALEIRQKLASEARDDPSILGDVARSFQRLGDVYWYAGRVDDAVDAYQEELAVCEQRVRANPGRDERRAEATALLNLGKAVLRRGDHARANRLYEQSLDIRRELVNEHPGNTKLARDLSSGFLRVGGMLNRAGAHPAALEQFREALRIRQDLCDKEPDRGQRTRDVDIARYFVAEAMIELAWWDKALEEASAALDSSRKHANAEPENVRLQRDVVAHFEQVGLILVRLDRAAEGKNHFETMHRIAVELWKLEPVNTQYAGLVAASHGHLADIAEREGDLDAAEHHYAEAVRILEDLHKRDAIDVDIRGDLAGMLREQGSCPTSRGEAGLEILDRSRRLYEELDIARWQDVRLRNGYAATLREFAVALDAAGDRPLAVARATEAARLLGTSTRPADAELRSLLEEDLARYEGR